MKAIIILADGTRYVDREIDEATLKRGYVELNREPSKSFQQTEQLQPTARAAQYFVCLHDGTQDGVPVFRERRPSTPTQKQ